MYFVEIIRSKRFWMISSTKSKSDTSWLPYILLICLNNLVRIICNVIFLTRSGPDAFVLGRVTWIFCFYSVVILVTFYFWPNVYILILLNNFQKFFKMLTKFIEIRYSIRRIIPNDIFLAKLFCRILLSKLSILLG